MNPDVVDIYQLNANNSHGGDAANFVMAKDFGIKGVIHKASQYRADTLCAIRRPKILAAGLLFGAYHFPTPASVQHQVDLFLSVAPASPDTFPFLDHETYQGYTFPLQSVVNFMDAIDQAYGRPCGLYSGNVIKEQMPHATDHQREFLAAHPYWICQYNTVPIMKDVNHHPLPWQDNFLWQYTGDGVGPGPHYVPGIGNGVDISTWAGDKAADLVTWWKTGAVAPLVA